MSSTKEASHQNADAPSNSQPELYENGFWDDSMRPYRKSLLQIWVLPLCLTTLLMWACLTLYWGSLYPSDTGPKLTVAVANLDQGSFGSQMVAALNIASQAPGDSFAWNFDGSNAMQTLDEGRLYVQQEEAWAVIFIPADATKHLEEDLASGNGSYNPQNALNLLYESARNQITVNSHVVAPLLGILNPLLGELSTQHTAMFLNSTLSDATRLATALQCPQCLVLPYGMTSIDVIPFDVPQAVGSTMVGLIFLLTFTFSVFNILRATGLAMGSHLNLFSAIWFRSAASLAAYLSLSLSYCLVNLAFGVPFNRRFGDGGFVIFWMLNFCTMGALGLTIESLFSFISLKWSGYFLSFWIVVNVSGGFSSFEIMPAFYQYGYAFPFYHSIQGARTIVFGTKNHLGLNFGVLIAWMVVGMLGMWAGTAWRLNANKKLARHDLP